MTKYECEFCNAVEDESADDSITVNAYLHEDRVRFACTDCVDQKIPSDDRTPMVLPNGWQIVDSLVLSAARDNHAEFVELATLVRNNAHELPHQHSIVRLFKDLMDHHNGKHKNNLVLHTKLGTAALDAHDISKARCPNCGGPMITVHTADQDDALKYAADDEDVVNRVMDAPLSLVCLNCTVVYTG